MAGTLVDVAVADDATVAVTVLPEVAVAVAACVRVAVGVAFGLLLLSLPQAVKSGKAASRLKTANRRVT